jgi:hypothetical protein
MKNVLPSRDCKKRLPPVFQAFLLLSLSLIPGFAQLRPAAAKQPAGAAPPVVKSGAKTPVPLDVLTELQKNFDDRLQAIGSGNNSVLLLGVTCGVYVGGYGAVFTSQVDLINTPRITPFQHEVDWAQVRQRKAANVPLLRQAIREIWLAAASKLTGVPENEQIVIAVRVLYAPSEDTRGLPGQILMKADRRGLITGNIEVEEQ